MKLDKSKQDLRNDQKNCPKKLRLSTHNHLSIFMQ